MRWAWHGESMGKKRVASRFLGGNQRETGHFKGLGVDARMMLKLLLKKLDRGVDWIDLAWEGHLADSCECDNKSSVSMQCEKYLD